MRTQKLSTVIPRVNAHNAMYMAQDAASKWVSTRNPKCAATGSNGGIDLDGMHPADFDALQRVNAGHERGLLNWLVSLAYSPSFKPFRLNWVGFPPVRLGGRGPLAHCKVPKHADQWLEELYGPEWKEPYYCRDYDETVMRSLEVRGRKVRCSVKEPCLLMDGQL